MRKPFKIIMKSGAVIDLRAETFHVRRTLGELTEIKTTGSDVHIMHLDLGQVAAIIQPLECEPDFTGYPQDSTGAVENVEVADGAKE